jgi:hypothetical protein
MALNLSIAQMLAQLEAKAARAQKADSHRLSDAGLGPWGTPLLRWRLSSFRKSSTCQARQIQSPATAIKRSPAFSLSAASRKADRKRPPRAHP